MSIDDVSYIAKLKGAGRSNETIAQKTGMTVEQVAEVLQSIEEAKENVKKSGYADLVDAFTVMCHQYQLLGESLKIIAGAIACPVSGDEIKAALVADPHQSFINLTSNFIVLKKFSMNPKVVEEEILGKINKN